MVGLSRQHHHLNMQILGLEQQHQLVLHKKCESGLLVLLNSVGDR